LGGEQKNGLKQACPFASEEINKTEKFPQSVLERSHQTYVQRSEKCGMTHPDLPNFISPMRETDD
jgi:hypothetical protein